LDYFGKEARDQEQNFLILDRDCVLKDAEEGDLVAFAERGGGVEGERKFGKDGVGDSPNFFVGKRERGRRVGDRWLLKICHNQTY